MRFDATLTGTGGSQSGAQTFRNGMNGYSGGLVTDRMKYAIDPYLATLVANAAGRPFVVLLAGGINDYSNNDTAGYDATIWADLKTIIEKVQAAGGLPLVKVNEPTSSLTTLTKRRNRSALADTVQTWAAGRTDVAVMDIEAAWRKYGQGASWERCTRGSTGDEVHPNLLGAILHGYAGRDALQPFVRFDPPWARNDFADTIATSSTAMLSGTTGTESTGADAAGEVPTGWTSATFGTNTSLRCDQELGPEGYGSRLVCVATGAPTADTFGLSLSAQPALAESTLLRGFVDLEIRKADYVNWTQFRVRTTGSTFVEVAKVGSTDFRAMTAASGAVPFVPSGAKLLEGQRVVLSSQPFLSPASPDSRIYEAGGGSGLTDAAARWEAYARFAGIISY